MADEQNNADLGVQKNPLVTILLIVNLIVMTAVGYFQFKAHEREAKRPSVRDVVKAQMRDLDLIQEEESNADISGASEEGFLLPLDGFTANLAQGDGPRRFIRLNLFLKFAKDSKKEEFNSRKPQIQDTIISILNSKRPEDLLKAEGKAFLKEEIKSAINSYLIDGHVQEVFYVSFQIN